MHGSIHLFDSLPRVSEPVQRALVLPGASARVDPLIGLIRNPRSHRSREHRPLPTGRFRLLAEAPSRRSELAAVLERFADLQIDYLAIDGGDGTVRDILTCGAGVFGDCWPDLILLPGGKTNALAHDLGLPARWKLADALAAIGRGGRAQRAPLVVAGRDMPDSRVQGFVFGAGVYTAAIGLGQSAHQRGAFGALAVATTTMWSAWQALTGAADNIWRRGTPMRLRDGAGRDLPRSDLGEADERYLVFASTLQRFPAGLRPFQGIGGRLRLAVLDHAGWGAMLRLPRLLAGHVGRNPARFGVHRFGLDRIEIDLGDSFILDGEAFPAGSYTLSLGPKLRFVVP